MASRVYELDGFQRPLAVVIGVVMVPLGIVLLLLIGDEGDEVAMGVCFIAIGVFSVLQFGFREPRRVTLDDSGVLLEAVARRVRIPWDELEAVEPWPWDLRRQSLRWRRRRGRAVTMLKDFSELHRLLVEVERRAPHAYVSS